IAFDDQARVSETLRLGATVGATAPERNRSGYGGNRLERRDFAEEPRWGRGGGKHRPRSVSRPECAPGALAPAAAVERAGPLFSAPEPQDSSGPVPSDAKRIFMARIRRHRRDTVQSPLETYLPEINEMALLTADEEKELAHRIARGDKLARD